MSAQNVPLERRMLLGMTHLDRTRSATRLIAPPMKEYWTMCARRAHQERRLPLGMTHLETARNATRLFAPSMNAW
jgi:hypothetical protein